MYKFSIQGVDISSGIHSIVNRGNKQFILIRNYDDYGIEPFNLYDAELSSQEGTFTFMSSARLVQDTSGNEDCALFTRMIKG